MGWLKMMQVVGLTNLSDEQVREYERREHEEREHEEGGVTNRDCKHGRLARSCEVCDLETQRDEAEEAADRLGRTLVASEQRVADLETALREIARICETEEEVGACYRSEEVAREALGESE